MNRTQSTSVGCLAVHSLSLHWCLVHISQRLGGGVGDAGWQHALWECHSVHSPEELRAWRPHHCVRVSVLYMGFLMSGATPYLGLTAIESLLEIRI